MRRYLQIMIVLLLVSVLMVGCAASSKWPRVCIQPTSYTADEIAIPLRDGHRFAEQFLEIVETERGYDIVVHAVKE